eukprot:403333185
MKNFYKIYQKFDKLSLYQEITGQTIDYVQKAEGYRKYLEKNCSLIKQKICHNQVDQEIQVNDFSQYRSIDNFESLKTPAKNNQITQNDDFNKDQMIQSLKSEVQALRILLYKDSQKTINFHNNETIDQRDASMHLTNSGSALATQNDEVEYKSLQVLRERLASLQKTQPDQNQSQLYNNRNIYGSSVKGRESQMSIVSENQANQIEILKGQSRPLTSQSHFNEQSNSKERRIATNSKSFTKFPSSHQKLRGQINISN